MTDWDELDRLILNTMEIYGNNCNLNWIDVSEMTEMDELFSENCCGKFKGDISRWDVSKVKTMCMMFYGSEFNGDISGWNVSRVEIMCEMFQRSKFTGDISGWDVSRVENMNSMFEYSDFNGDISGWDIRRVKDFEDMFTGSKFKRSLASWLHKNLNFSYKTAGL